MQETKIYYPGLDLLKFLMSILIVAGHSQLFIENELLYNIIYPLRTIIIPTFFAISSFLFFSRIYNSLNNEHEIYIRTIKRIGTIFCIWYIISLPMTYYNFLSIANFKEIMYAIVFSCTCSGYWFLKSLLINTIILYHYRKAINWISFISLIIFIFWSYNYEYSFININFSPYYSFYYNTIFFAIGVLLYSNKKAIFLFKAPASILVVITIFIYLLSYNTKFDPICRIINPFILIPLFCKLNINKTSIFKKLRQLSIMLYVTHFMLIWIYNNFCNHYLNHTSDIYQILQYSVTRFIVVLSIALGLSLLILKLEKKPTFSFLNKLH